jgi:Tfp pilus assembly protein PilE
LHKREGGFAFIELMIAIACGALIVYLAVEAYNKHILRAKVIEGITVLHNYAKQYEDYFNEHGSLPQYFPDTIIATPNTNIIDVVYAGSQSSGTGMYLYATFQNKLGLGTANRLMLALIQDPSTRTIQQYCGQWDSTKYVSTDYLPIYCSTQNIDNLPGMIN